MVKKDGVSIVKKPYLLKMLPPFYQICFQRQLKNAEYLTRSFRQIPRFWASGVPSSQNSAKVDRQIGIGKTSDRDRLKLILKIWLLIVANTAGSTSCS